MAVERRLLESGDFRLLEDGTSFRLLETSSGEAAVPAGAWGGNRARYGAVGDNQDRFNATGGNRLGE